MQYFGKTDMGMKRQDNQDSFITEQLSEDTVLCLVCDGMGGANGGKTASELACTTFTKNIKKRLSDFTSKEQIQFDEEDIKCETALKKAIDSTNTTVFRKANKNKNLSGMGTTLVCALVVNNKLYAANVGDSRLYSVSKNEITQLSHDHSYVQTLVDLGQITPEEAATNPHRNIITRAIGIHKTEDPDIFLKDLSKTDTEYLLLCSDGLTNFIDINDAHKIIIDEEKSLEEKCTALIDKANENGGGDNITVILIKV